MKLGLSIGYSKATIDLPVALVQRAEELGIIRSGVPRCTGRMRSRRWRSWPR